MANNNRLTGAATVIREEDLEDLQKFERDLQERVEQAREDGRAYMMAQYVRILAGVKAEAKRLRDRFDRELMAQNRKAQKELSKTAREQDENA